MTMKNQIFLKLKFYLIGEISDEIKCLIKEGGGKIDYYLSEMVNYVLAEDDTSDEYSEAIDLFQIPVITSNWIKKSYKCGGLLPVERFSPDSEQLFKDVRTCPYKVSRADSQNIWALVSGHGGHCQTKLDAKITHLVTTVTEGVKHDYIKRHSLTVKIVTPDWFEACADAGKLCDELVYHPMYLCDVEAMAPAVAVAVAPAVAAIGGGGDAIITSSSSSSATSFSSSSSSSGSSVVASTAGSLDSSVEPVIVQPVEDSKPKRNVPKYIHNLLLDADITAIPELPVKRPAFEYKEPKAKIRKTMKPGVVKALATTGPMKMPSNLHQHRQHQMAAAAVAAAAAGGVSKMSTLNTPPYQKTPSTNITSHQPAKKPSGIKQHRGGAATSIPMPRQAGPPCSVSVDNKRPNVPKLKLLPPPPIPPTPKSMPPHTKPPPAPVTGPPYPSVVPPMMDTPPSFNGNILAGRGKHDDKPDLFLAKFCMAGCVFLITDYETHVDKASLNVWKQVIKNNGGLCSESYTNSVTHLICESLTSNLAKAALKSGKRLVTAHWLNDCLTIKKMKRPWLLTHLPVAFPLSKRPCTNQIITITNFEGLERQRVKYLIMSTGAKYTNYLTKAHSLLISKRPSGVKYASALQWNIPVANVEFLAQLVFGSNPEKVLCIPLSDVFTQDLNRDVTILRTHKCQHILEAWNVNVNVTEEYQNTINAMMTDKNEAPKSPSNDDAEISFERNKNSKYQILITGVSNTHKFNKIVYDLGGVCLKVAQSPAATVTHLVANKVLMTEKFLSAFSRTKFVITTDWLLGSLAEGRFIDEARFILKDDKAEVKFNFNMLESILLSSKKGVFEGMTFYLSPCLQSCRTSLSDMIASGHGKVTSKQPNASQLSTANDCNNMMFIISEDVDMYLFRSNKIREVVYSSDLILYSILQQRIDLPKHKLQF